MTTVVRQDGRTMQYVSSGGNSAGDVIEFTEAIGVVLDDIAAGATGTLIMLGVVELVKETGVVFTQGDMLYWDATNNRLDKTTSNIPAGIAWNDVASGVLLAEVSLNMGAKQE